jgi:hypothetical protein
LCNQCITDAAEQLTDFWVDQNAVFEHFVEAYGELGSWQHMTTAPVQHLPQLDLRTNATGPTATADNGYMLAAQGTAAIGS